MGDAKDVQETVTGVDVVTGDKLGTKERIFTGICIVLPVVNGKAFRVGGDAAKTVKVGKVVGRATASVPIAIKITKEESGIMKLMVKKADESGSKIARAIEESKVRKIGDDGAEILGKKVTKEAVESGSSTMSNVSKASPFDLQATHSQTLSKKSMNKLIDDIKDNGISETIKYVEHNGQKYVVDGHHRLIAAKRLGLEQVPIEQVELPYSGYKTIEDLLWFG